MAGEQDADRESGRQPALRLVPGQQVPEASAGHESEPPGQAETHTRTFLIADVRGYTTFTAARGDEAAGALAARFAAVTRAVVAEHAGLLTARTAQSLGSTRAPARRPTRWTSAPGRPVSRSAAGRLWQQVDREVVDQAALLPVGIRLDVTVTSRRVGNYLHQPGPGVLLDQLWVNR
jgi:class 3 adenylate cyclase